MGGLGVDRLGVNGLGGWVGCRWVGCFCWGCWVLLLGFLGVFVGFVGCCSLGELDYKSRVVSRMIRVSGFLGCLWGVYRVFLGGFRVFFRCFWNIFLIYFGWF